MFSKLFTLLVLQTIAATYSQPMAEFCDDGSMPLCPDGSALLPGVHPPCADGKPVCANGSIAKPPHHGPTGSATGGEVDFKPCDDDSTPTCPDGSALVLGEHPPCKDGKPVCADGSIAKPPHEKEQGGKKDWKKGKKHGKHGGKHDKPMAEGKHGDEKVQEEHHFRGSDGIKSKPDAMKPCNDCEDEDEKWWDFHHDKNATRMEKRKRMKRDGKSGLIGLLLGTLVGYLIGSKRCCCCCKKKNTEPAPDNRGELVVLGSIASSPSVTSKVVPTTPSAPITSTSVYSANTVV